MAVTAGDWEEGKFFWGCKDFSVLKEIFCDYLKKFSAIFDGFGEFGEIKRISPQILKLY